MRWRAHRSAQGRIDRVLKILDPVAREEGKSEERRLAIRKVAQETFDFREISQRALARHWQGRTAAERDDFVELFTDLVERSYIGQIEQYAAARGSCTSAIPSKAISHRSAPSS